MNHTLGVAQRTEPVSAELDLKGYELLANINAIKGLLERIRNILAVSKEGSCTPPEPPMAPSTITELLKNANVDMVSIARDLNQLISELEAKVGELKILD